MSAEITLEDFEPARLEELRELGVALHRHEANVSAALGHAEVRSEEEYWDVYTSRFNAWYSDGDGFIIVARGTVGELLGFVFAVGKEGTTGYHSGDRIGYIEEMVVAEGARGRGIGSALMAAARARFAERGYVSFMLSSVPGNDAARRFYAREGLQPAAFLMIGEVQPDR